MGLVVAGAWANLNARPSRAGRLLVYSRALFHYIERRSVVRNVTGSSRVQDMMSEKERATALRVRANAYRDIAVRTSDRKMHTILLRLADACEEAAAQIEREAEPREPER